MPFPQRWKWKLERWRERLAGNFGSRKENPRPRLCPACGTLVGATATRCHECGASMTFSLAAASRSLGGLFDAAAPVTYILIGVDVILYLFSLMITIRMGAASGGGGGLGGLFGLGGIGQGVLLRLGASIPLFLMIETYQPWRLVTAVFLHGSLLHLAFNMWFLMDIGPQIEELYGSARYLFIYVFTGAFGFVASAWGNHVSIGASGALMGLVGLMLGMTSGRATAAMQMLRSQMIQIVIYIAVMGFLMSGIDNWAHFGGLAAGFLLGKIMTDRAPSSPSERSRAYALGWAAGFIVLASFVLMFLTSFRAG